MKYISHLFLIVIIGLSFSLSSCQDESEEIVRPIPTETISKGSKSGLFLSKISQRDGSSDNIIDGASCTSIVFPFTVIVNGTSIRITSEEDYDLVEDIIDELEDDTDSVAIQFPVNVMLSDHSILKVNNMDELEDLLDECVEGGFDDDIECVDIAYPIIFSIYNEATQQASNVTIENDNELYQFLDDIKETDIVSLNYPIVLILLTGETITVETNEELETTLELYEDSCDEDDDNDYDDDDVDDTELINTLKQNIWIVTAYDSSSIDRTDLFNSYEISFLEPNFLLANSEAAEIEGEWDTNGNYGFLELSIDFDTDGNLRLLNDEWRVSSFDGTQIDLINQESDNPIVVRLTAK
jgi:hypothetical protein